MKENLISKIQKLGHFFERWDLLWTLPLSIFMYWFFGYFCGDIMGMSVGNFDLSFVQPLFLAVTVVFAASTTAIYVLRFHFKKMFQYIYSGRDGDPNLNSVLDFEKLEPWQKIVCNK